MDSPELDQRIIRKAEAVIRWRTSRITVVVERCTNDHNYSAILRTAEALGIQNVWLIDPPPPPTILAVDNNKNDDDGDADAVERVTTPVETWASGKPIGKGVVTEQAREQRALHHLFAQKANEWLTLRDFSTTTECVQELRKTGHDIWVTDLSQLAVCLTPEELMENGTSNTTNGSSFSLPPKLAIVFGTESVGATDEMLQAADKRVYLPLRGFADSLNLGVATALVLQQLFLLDPTVVGGMPEEERRELRQAWYVKLCQQRLLTPAQKRQRHRVLASIKKCEKIQSKIGTNSRMQPGELEKLNELEGYQRQLQEFEETALFQESKDGKSSVLHQAIQDLIDCPPSPLTDLRRADVHRVCFVGKNTKKQNESNWKNMVATSNYDTTAARNTTSSFFRDRVQQAAASASASTSTETAS